MKIHVAHAEEEAMNGAHPSRSQNSDPWLTLPLHPEARADLQKSGLLPETVRALNIHSVPPGEITQHLGFHDPRITSVLCFPYPGESGFCRDKLFPDNLKDAEGHARRYHQRGDSGCHMYVPPLAAQVLDDPSIPMRFTEGEKKSAKACQEGYHCIGMGGLWNFSENGQLLPKFDEIALRGRQVILVPDGEVWTSRKDLLDPVYRLGRLLEARGAIVSVEVLV
jgi:hypothetical protein